ncbi:hypothetical protein DFJ73DRAFT_794859 [Zopfochytrium polystomum]|nr:hypothetical protein DFJ73DRAFT_794859 [Zopfochytrium polystomum]
MATTASFPVLIAALRRRVDAPTRAVLLAVALPLAALEGVLVPLRSELIGAFVDLLSSSSSSSSSTSPSVGTATAATTSAIASATDALITRAVGLALVTWAVSAASAFVWSAAAAWWCNRLSRQYYAAFLRQDEAWRQAHQSGKLALELSGISKIQEAVSDHLRTTVKSVALFALGLFLAFRTGWQLAVVVLCSFPVVGLILANMWKQCRIFDERIYSSYLSAASHAAEILGATTTVAAFNLQESEAARYEAHLAEAKAACEKNAVAAGVGWGAYSASMFAAFAVAFGVGGWLVSLKIMTPGEVLSTFTQIAVGITAIGDLSSHFQFIAEAGSLGMRLFEVIEAKPTIDASSEEGRILSTFRGKIEFRSVVFRYPSRPDALVLKGFSLVIEPGQTVGLIAKSGEGKSTLFALLLRLYDPEGGKILVDDVDIKELNVSWLRKQIAYMSQNTVLFDGTIGWNLSLGHPYSSNVPLSSIEAALDVGDAREFVERLPDGLETVVSSTAAQSGLSGGQRQRLGLARALVGDRAVALLDEPTSALDKLTERKVTASLRQALKGRTALIISHRKDVLRDTDLVAVLEDGRLARVGTPADILSETSSSFQNDAGFGLAETLLRAESKMEDDGGLLGNDGAVPRSVETARVVEGTGTESTETNEAQLESSLGSGRIDWPFLFRLAAPHWKYISAAYVASFVEGFQFPLEGYFIASVVASYSIPDTADQFRETLKWSLALVLLGLGSFLTGLVKQVGFGFSGARMTLELRAKLFRAMLRQDASFFASTSSSPQPSSTASPNSTSPSSASPSTPTTTTTTTTTRSRAAITTADLELRLVEDARLIDRVPAPYVSDVIMGAVNTSAGLAIATTTSWRLTAGLLLAAPAVGAAVWAQDRAVSMLRPAALAAGEAQLRYALQTLAGSGGAATAVVALSAQERVAARYDALARRARACQVRDAALAAAFGGALRECLVSTLAVYGLAYGIAAVGGGGSGGGGGEGMRAEDLLRVVTTMTLTAVSSVRLFGEVLGSGALQGVRRSFGRVAEILERVPAIDVWELGCGASDEGAAAAAAKDEARGGGGGGGGKGEVEFDGVSFSYAGRRNAPAMRDVSFVIEKGQKVGIVGPSGSGKSTILQLLLRLYDPTSGAIRVTGRDIRSLPVLRLRRRVGFAAQDAVLFHRSIAENISLGRAGCSAPEAVARAAKLANAHEFIEALPQGYDTVVGARGSSLSGGQMQRIALARVFAGNPDIILLDEATSAQDEAGGLLLFQGIDRAAEAGGKTVFIVSHDAQAVRGCDLIAVMREGRLVEIGSHAQLKLGVAPSSSSFLAPLNLTVPTNPASASSSVPDLPARTNPTTATTLHQQHLPLLQQLATVSLSSFPSSPASPSSLSVASRDPTSDPAQSHQQYLDEVYGLEEEAVADSRSYFQYLIASSSDSLASDTMATANASAAADTTTTTTTTTAAASPTTIAVVTASNPASAPLRLPNLHSARTRPATARHIEDLGDDDDDEYDEDEDDDDLMDNMVGIADDDEDDLEDEDDEDEDYDQDDEELEDVLEDQDDEDYDEDGDLDSEAGADSVDDERARKEKEEEMQQQQAELRKQIVLIQQDPEVPSAEKAKKIQELMTRAWATRVKSRSSKSASMCNKLEDKKGNFHDVTDADIAKTYHASYNTKVLQTVEATREDEDLNVTLLASTSPTSNAALMERLVRDSSTASTSGGGTTAQSPSENESPEVSGSPPTGITDPVHPSTAGAPSTGAVVSPSVAATTSAISVNDYSAQDGLALTAATTATTPVATTSANGSASTLSTTSVTEAVAIELTPATCSDVPVATVGQSVPSISTETASTSLETTFPAWQLS